MNINRVELKRNKPLQYGNYPTKIILHHADMNGSVIDVNQVHLDKGWCMIGYNFYVRKDGTVWKGRDDDAIGAHCYGQNATSIGICFEGNFMIDYMQDSQLNAGIELCKYLMQEYPNIKEINGHKKYYNTDCPGINFPLDKIIAESIEIHTPIINPIPAVHLIKLWDSGSEVKEVQEKLLKLGYDLGKWGADSGFGQMTYNAVELFQSQHGLQVDGIVGPKTMTALDAAIVAMNVIDIHSIRYLQHEINVQFKADLKQDNEAGKITLASCPIIRYGAQGNITKWIQTKLGIDADGEFGKLTFIAVQNFQAKHGLVADGIVGPKTWAALLGL